MTRRAALDFSLRQLQYALAVAEEGGFGKAARACGVSQPSLSAQLARLEEALGLRLFERHARGVQLTRAGREMLPRMRAAVEAADAVEGAARLLGDPGSVTLRVGVIPTIAPYLLPRAVDHLARLPSPPRVHWLERQTAVCEEELAAGAMDAMIIADPPRRPSLDALRLGWEPFWLAVPEDHPLRGPVSVDDVAAHEVLLLEDGHCLRDHTLSLCMVPGAKESPYEATSLPTLVQMVASGLGTSVLPQTAIPVEAGRARVRVLPFDDPGIGRTHYLGWRSRSPEARLVRALAAPLRAALAEALADGAPEAA